MSASVEELRQEALVGPRIWAKKCHWRFGKSANDFWIAKDAIFQRCKAKLLGMVYVLWKQSGCAASATLVFFCQRAFSRTMCKTIRFIFSGWGGLFG
tara:strand:- start:164 stop:454 length:291 start_codon:yes stop_codon:yes gene_type:complete